MTWAELYSEAARPTLEEIDAYGAYAPLAAAARVSGGGLWGGSAGWSTAGAVWSRDGM